MKLHVGWALRILGVLAVVLVLFLIISLQMNLSEIRKQNEELSRKVEEYSDKVDELQYQLDRKIDDEYLEEYARKKFGYYKLGDTVFYFDSRD